MKKGRDSEGLLSYISIINLYRDTNGGAASMYKWGMGRKQKRRS
jgi:hypothetical protein